MTSIERVAAEPATVLAGQPVGELEGAVCSACQRTVRMREGDRVRCYAYRAADVGTWSVAELRCLDCHEHGRHLKAPTLGLAEIVADARLAIRADVARQRTQLVLVGVDVLATSATAEGTAEAVE